MTSNSFFMQKLKSSLVAVIGMITVVFLFSCKKEEVQLTAQPIVVLNEIGLDNSMIAYAGNDLHLDAEIVAAGKIASIKIQITLATSNYGWDFQKTYTTPYVGLKNADFHEHIDVPENAKAGKYELLVIVTDQLGGKTQVKQEFEVIKDLSLPGMKDASVKASSAVNLAVSGTITAPNKIAKVIVEVQSSAWTKAFDFTDVEMVGQISFSFKKEVDMSSAPNGHYHVNITVIDIGGKQAIYAFHLDR